MATFAEKYARWEPLHRNPVCRAAHLAGAFLFLFAALTPFGWARFELAGADLSFGVFATLAACALAISVWPLGGLLESVLIIAPAAAAAHYVSRLPMLTGALCIAGALAIRFPVVIASHLVFEKKKHGLELGGPLLFLTEPVYLFAHALKKF
jgi:hypothetical protein